MQSVKCQERENKSWGGGIDEEQKHKKMDSERRNFLCVCVHVKKWLTFELGPDWC